jgi:hypothetical protein
MLKLNAFIAFVILGFNIFGQTMVSGGIYQNTTWSLAASPYEVTGSVVVFPGKTLTIEPGVEIRINNLSDSTIYIETRGTLNCVGTDILPIKIRTMFDTTSIGWQGFKCTNSQGGVLNADRFHISNASTPFAYETPEGNLQYTNCKFSHCFQAISVNNSVNLQNCQFINNEVAVYGWSYYVINNCFFKDNTTSIYAYSTALTLTNTTFVDNQIGLSFASNVFDSIYISDCQFLNNEVGINYPNKGKVKNCIFNDNTTAIKFAYECEIFDNEFFYNELAIEASINTIIFGNLINNNIGGLLISGVSNVQDSPQVYGNEICGNINFSVNNNTNMNYSLLENCFCGLDSAEIEASLIDGYDDITKGLINFQIYDITCSTILNTILKFNANTTDLYETNFDFSFVNPVVNSLVFESSIAILSFEIIDLVGKHYFFKTINANQFDISSLNSGYYIIKKINNHSADKKIIKL